MSFDIDMSGLQSYINRVQSLGDDDVFASISTDAARAAGVYAEKQISEYPPKRNPDSKYKRTGTLGKSITSAPSIIGGVSGFFIGSNVNYAKHVIGTPLQQLPVNRDWWTPLVDDIYYAMPDIARVYVAIWLKEALEYLQE